MLEKTPKQLLLSKTAAPPHPFGEPLREPSAGPTARSGWNRWSARSNWRHECEAGNGGFDPSSPEAPVRPHIERSSSRWRTRQWKLWATCRSSLRPMRSTWTSKLRIAMLHRAGLVIGPSVPTAAEVRRRAGHPVGRRSLLRRSALTATRMLEPDIERAAISGLRVKPKTGWNTPAARGSAIAL